MNKLKRSPALIALLQVLGVAVYVLALSLMLTRLEGILGNLDNTILAPAFFLLTFVTSALICGSLVLGYPLYLFLSNEKTKAVKMVLYSAMWFVVILFLYVIISMLLLDNRATCCLGI